MEILLHAVEKMLVVLASYSCVAVTLSLTTHAIPHTIFHAIMNCILVFYKECERCEGFLSTEKMLQSSNGDEVLEVQVEIHDTSLVLREPIVVSHLCTEVLNELVLELCAKAEGVVLVSISGEANVSTYCELTVLSEGSHAHHSHKGNH